MKTRRLFLLALAMALLCGSTAVPAGEGPFRAGEIIPAFNLSASGDAAQAAYLGLPEGQAAFSLDRIGAPLVFLQIFNMYCTICQAEAGRVNELFAIAGQGPLRDKVRFIGIGVGNSPFEVDVYRKKYDVMFPLFPDSDYTLHKLFREPRTPYFLILQTKGEDSRRVLYSNLGPFGRPEDMAETIVKLTGME